jgi:hypothetical protein
MLCPADNRWIVTDQARCDVREVTWWGTDKQYHYEGKVLHVAHRIPHSSGTREVEARLPISAVVDALLADPEVAEALMVETARAAARRLYAVRQG